MKPKVIVIVGPTASGKTALAIEIAKQCNGEVISADSRQVYRGLDLGTGKVTAEEMQGVPHHVLDVADPRIPYNASDYERDAKQALTDILSRGKTPIIAGGTFFYIDILLGKISLPDVPPNPLLRQELEILAPETLHARLKEKDPRYAELVDKDNPHRLIRAIEIIEALGQMPAPTKESLYDVLTLGVSIPKEILHEKVHKRIHARIEAGMIEEVRKLTEEGVSYERMQDLGLEYRYISRYLKGTLEYETMLSELETKTKQYAKRQMTWLKRDQTIVWLNPLEVETAVARVATFIQNES